MDVFFILIFPFLIIAFIMFDLIIRYEYTKYHEIWKKDGGPLGFFGILSGANILTGSFARNRLTFKWLFKTPY